MPVRAGPPRAAVSPPRFVPTKEWKPWEKSPHEWPPLQGQAKGIDKSKIELRQGALQLYDQYVLKAANE